MSSPVTPALTSRPAPPTIPPRNGSKLEHSQDNAAVTTKKYFDTNIEPIKSEVSADQKSVSDGKEDGGDVTDKSTGSYKELVKPRSDPAASGQNTLVFNFVNSKKDVSHIENDGLDLTNRTKKVG